MIGMIRALTVQCMIEKKGNARITQYYGAFA